MPHAGVAAAPAVSPEPKPEPEPEPDQEHTRLWQNWKYASFRPSSDSGENIDAWKIG
jgi:hypothetical protein